MGKTLLHLTQRQFDQGHRCHVAVMCRDQPLGPARIAAAGHGPGVDGLPQEAKTFRPFLTVTDDDQDATAAGFVRERHGASSCPATTHFIA